MPGPMDDIGRRVSAMRDFVDQIRDTARDLGRPGTPQSAQPPRQPPRDTGPSLQDIRRANTALIIAFVAGMRWSLRVPGMHTEAPTRGMHAGSRHRIARAHRSATVSNDDLLGYLAAMGKDFGADSRSLHNRVKIDLLNEFENYPRLIQAPQLKQFASAMIIATIVKRIKEDLRDVRITANKPATTARKAALGQSQRVGEAGGGLVSAIEHIGAIDFE
jgi:hypothetical protein